MKWVKLERTIYPVTIYFAQGGTVKEIVAKLKRLKLTADEDVERKFARGKQLGWTLKLTTKENQFAVLIWVGSCKRNWKDIAVLSHECLHATYMVFQYISLGVGATTYEDQELHCYYLDYLVGKALAGFWKPQLNTVDF